MDTSNTVQCAECGDSFVLMPKPGQTRFSMPSLLDPTEYACSRRCFDRWKAKRWTSSSYPAQIVENRADSRSFTSIRRKFGRNKGKSAEIEQEPLF